MPDDLLSLLRSLRQQPNIAPVVDRGTRSVWGYEPPPPPVVGPRDAISGIRGDVTGSVDQIPLATGLFAQPQWHPDYNGTHDDTNSIKQVADTRSAAPEPQGDLSSGGFSPEQASKWQQWRNAQIEAQNLPPAVTQYMENNEDYGEGERTNQVNPNAPASGPTPPALIWPRSLDSRQGPALTPQGAAQSPGMTEDWFHNYQQGAAGPIQQISDLMTALRSAPSVSKLLSPAGQATGDQQRKMPGPGFIPGALNLNAAIAPKVPEGAARPFAPGEHIRNPDGSWSSEETVTVSGDKSFNGGNPTVLPSLWVKDGKAYVAKDEDEATALAKASGLTWPSFPTMDAAEHFANTREQTWQGMEPQGASGVAPLWTSPEQYIEPPPKPAQ